MSNKDCFLKPVRTYLFILVALLQAHPVYAEPPQRLIIQFNISLSAEQTKILNQQLQSIITSGFSVLSNSTEQKWIIVINPTLEKENLDKVIAEISRLEHVHYAEPDLLMNRLHPEIH